MRFHDHLDTSFPPLLKLSLHTSTPPQPHRSPESSHPPLTYLALRSLLLAPHPPEQNRIKQNKPHHHLRIIPPTDRMHTHSRTVCMGYCASIGTRRFQPNKKTKNKQKRQKINTQPRIIRFQPYSTSTSTSAALEYFFFLLIPWYDFRYMTSTS